MDSIDDIISDIESAFAGVPRGRVTLHEAEVMDLHGTAAELSAARKRDPESDWRDVPGMSIEECRAALTFVDEESFRFYLPAYMRWGLRQLHAPRNSAIDVSISSLDCGLGSAELVAAKRKKFDSLGPAQARAVRRFLAFASQHDDLCDGVVAQQALEAYWSNAKVD